MQRVIPENRLQDVRTRLLEEIKATKKRKHPVNHPLFNLTMQNKIDHANRILRLMDRYPNMTVEELFYLIACRIEGEKFVVSCYRWSVPMLQETYDNRDNLERLQYLVRPSFRTVYSEVLDDLRKEMRNCFVEISHKEAFDLLYKEAWHEFKERIDEILDLQDITNLILQFL